ncbi:granzyme G isoform X4 [Lates calcarifer]|uniref:trypsin n=1 Tax=Lates calcarifer TaxID=8187 RepID=A0AAJ8BJJ2_LATCA|nr:granzyme G isoform X4 [Lates calcarifer]
MQATQTLPSLSKSRKRLKTELVSDVHHCSSVAQLDCELTMFFHCELVVLILALTLNGQVHTGEIYGGHEAKPHSRPYMVLLERHMQNGQTSYCGGFLLNKDFVMTAAHCQAKSYTALLGVHNAHNCAGVQRIPVKAAFPHKDYNETEYTNDIMLLKLSSKAHFNNNVRSIALADRDDGSLPKSCSVSGWGRNDRNSKHMSLTLMEVNVTLTENESCCEKKTYCSEGEAGPGEGDAGGPLVCEDGKAYGVVSHTFNKASGGPPIYAYTKIPEDGNQLDDGT